ncbi:hypothetical protein MKW94_000513 [Papaver nudicaule]|uniref:Methyltransferase domain-containing protein n=1 Tax=Papaver nudicaule TaxID=74823 RepID=A0AA41UZ16_PAPNU|nr:hypothetical protein [Papaver nudicaule]
MKLEQLESYLGNLDQFSNPKIEHERYPTGSHIASEVIHRLFFCMSENSFGDINGKVVADFGCGCGTFSIASALLGVKYVVGIDVDTESLETPKTTTGLQLPVADNDINNITYHRVKDATLYNSPLGTLKIYEASCQLHKKLHGDAAAKQCYLRMDLARGCW